MAMRRLSDPILNDLLLMLQGRRLNDLTPAAQSRYIKHLDRIDQELATARANGGSIPLAFNDDSVLITKMELDHLRGQVAQLTTACENGDVALALAEGDVATLRGFGDTLFTEFSADLALVSPEATGPAEAAIELLRAFKADLDRVVGVPVQTSAEPPSPKANRRSR